MPDIEYWKQRARDAEQKLLDLGGKAKEGARDLAGKGKAKGAELLEKGKRGAEMGAARAGIDLDEPTLPQLMPAPVGRAVDKAGNALDRAGDAITDKAGDLKSLFLDKVLGSTNSMSPPGGAGPGMNGGMPHPSAAGTPPYMYGGESPPAPSGFPTPGGGGSPYMYGGGGADLVTPGSSPIAGEQPGPYGPGITLPSPGDVSAMPRQAPYMYQGSTPDTPQSMYNVPEQSRMERALRAAEEAYRRALGGQ